MTARSPKPRTLADVLASVHEAFDAAKHGNRPAPKPLPLPPDDAPPPPQSHHEREPGEDRDHEA